MKIYKFLNNYYSLSFLCIISFARNSVGFPRSKGNGISNEKVIIIKWVIDTNQTNPLMNYLFLFHMDKS